jgi:hypothetical protein
MRRRFLPLLAVLLCAHLPQVSASEELPADIATGLLPLTAPF